jgi:hypothetical protein
MPDPAARQHVLRRAFAVWLLLIAVEFVHGVLRTIFLVPVVGDFRARQIGVFTGSVLILAVAYLLVGRLHATNTRWLILVGLLWLALTVAFELSFGHFVFRRSWQDLDSDYNVGRGGLLPIGLLVLTLSPLMAKTLRGLRGSQ